MAWRRMVSSHINVNTSRCKVNVPSAPFNLSDESVMKTVSAKCKSWSSLFWVHCKKNKGKHFAKKHKEKASWWLTSKLTVLGANISGSPHSLDNVFMLHSWILHETWWVVINSFSLETCIRVEKIHLDIDLIPFYGNMRPTRRNLCRMWRE